MPELPEVEVVRRGIDRWVVGRTIVNVEVFGDRTIRRHDAGPEDFRARVTGTRVARAERRGKYLWLVLERPDHAENDSPQALVVHLGMSGQVLVQPEELAHEKHLRACFQLQGYERQMRFVDQRTFGGLHIDDLVESQGQLVPSSVAHIALDPLDARFDLAATTTAIRSKSSDIKRVILDQGIVSGIGNIYADESLWRAGIHWGTPANRLSAKRVEALLASAIAVMSEALDQGGTSFDSLYVNVNGESGYFSRSLNAYGREGEPCHECGSLIVREHFMNRSSYRCPHCQRRR